jgi:hypothetical protein
LTSGGYASIQTPPGLSWRYIEMAGIASHNISVFFRGFRGHKTGHRQRYGRVAR